MYACLYKSKDCVSMVLYSIIAAFAKDSTTNYRCRSAVVFAVVFCSQRFLFRFFLFTLYIYNCLFALVVFSALSFLSVPL